jgi:hypothetical protein
VHALAGHLYFVGTTTMVGAAVISAGVLGGAILTAGIPGRTRGSWPSAVVRAC